MKKLLILIIFCSFSITSCSKTNCSELKYNNGITKLNGELFNGSCKSFYFTGEIKSKEEYLNGLDHGKWVFYYRNGFIQTQGEFNKGKRIGTWKYYFEDSKPWKIHQYDLSGNKIGKWIEYNKNGDIISDN